MDMLEHSDMMFTRVLGSMVRVRVCGSISGLDSNKQAQSRSFHQQAHAVSLTYPLVGAYSSRHRKWKGRVILVYELGMCHAPISVNGNLIVGPCRCGNQSFLLDLKILTMSLDPCVNFHGVQL